MEILNLGLHLKIKFVRYLPRLDSLTETAALSNAAKNMMIAIPGMDATPRRG
jgi:hypothetical protein